MTFQAQPCQIAVIGCGSISRFHFAALQKLGVTVRWVCDLVDANARPYAKNSTLNTPLTIMTYSPIRR